MVVNDCKVIDNKYHTQPIMGDWEFLLTQESKYDIIHSIIELKNKNIPLPSNIFIEENIKFLNNSIIFKKSAIEEDGCFENHNNEKHSLSIVNYSFVDRIICINIDISTISNLYCNYEAPCFMIEIKPFIPINRFFRIRNVSNDYLYKGNEEIILECRYPKIDFPSNITGLIRFNEYNSDS